MDVTPQELRGSEIKEAFRGYHRDEVDDLLERAAVTIENLTRQTQELASRGPVDAPMSQASRDDADTIQRTLILAQRAADEAVAEAQARARQILDESEARAQTLVGEAEATARRIHEGERRRLEAEVAELIARRDRLAADADALEEYAGGYRERVRAAIEADLANLGDVVEPPSPRPELSEDPEPAEAPSTSYSPEPAPAPFAPLSAAADENATQAFSAFESPSASASYAPSSYTPSSYTPPAYTPPVYTPEPPVAVVAPAPAPAETEWPPPAPAAGSELQIDDEMPWGIAEAAGSSVAEPPAAYEASSAAPFASDVPMEAQAVDTDSLDDDAFFASLRDAVRDDAPLGPDDTGASSAFFDDAAPEEPSRRFRRR